MIEKILIAPSDYEKILDYAIGCIVTEEEHRLLNEIDKENPDIDGWERYRLADIKIFDIKENRELNY